MLGLITFALFIGVIWLEIIVFGLVGDAIGVLLTIIGVFVTAAIGIRLFRASGRATMARMQESVKAGRPPVLDVADGMAILFAAFLLLIPGYATDALGLILFIPGLRPVLILGLYFLLKPLVQKMYSNSSFQFNQSGFTSGFQGGFQGGFKSTDHPHHPDTQFDDQRHLHDDDPSATIIEGDYERKDKD